MFGNPCPWFETVAEARRRARKRLPYAAYGALLAGSEHGRTVADNVGAGVTVLSVSNHGGNNLGTTPATIRLLPSTAESVGELGPGDLVIPDGFTRTAATAR